MSDKSKVAIVSFSKIHSDGRVLRQIDYLSKQFEVDVIGYGHLAPSLEGKARMLAIQPPTAFARRSRKMLFLSIGKVFSRSVYEAWYWGESEYRIALDLLIKSSADAIHANDWESLPVVARAAQKTGAHIVLDLHEYAPLMRDNRWYWKTFYKPLTEYFLQKYISCISASVTVNQTIADRYADEYGIQPIVVMNVPKCTTMPEFRPTNPEHIRLVHHGNAIRDRKLELMIETLSFAPSHYTLHFMLIERSRGYISDLKSLAQRLAPGRVFFHHPVTPAEIVGRISEFDVGFYLMPAESFNQLAASPNKFFEFVMAGLAVCIGPSPEMTRLTQQFGFGLIAPSLDPNQVSRTLSSSSAVDIDRMKLKAIEARKVLNADIELGKLLQLYSNLFAGEG